MISDSPDIERLIQNCRENGEHAFGTSYIFRRRADRLRSWRNILTYVGIAVPTVLGGMALASGRIEAFGQLLEPVATTLLLIQLAVNLWAVVVRWNEQYDYAVESADTNMSIANQYFRLAEEHPADFLSKKQDLDRVDEDRSNKDRRQGLSRKDERYGMRAMLFHRHRPCATCGQVPSSMVAGKCDTCGCF